MSTKGPSNQYGNTRGSRGRGMPTKCINYAYARGYNKSRLAVDFTKHGRDFGVSTKEAYVTHAVHFANTIDRRNCISFVDTKGTTHKYNRVSNVYVAVDKRGYVVTYFKPSQGILYYQRKKKEKSK